MIKEKNDLKQQLNNEKNKNKQLSEEIELLKNKNMEKENIVNNLKMKLENLTNKNKELEEKINKQIENINLIKSESLKALLNKDNEIEELKIKLSRYPLELNEGEKLISINFKSLDSKLCYSIICKETELFYNIEKKLYEHNKEYYESENYFTVNGMTINKLDSLKKNGIKDNDIIILNKLDI